MTSIHTRQLLELEQAMTRFSTSLTMSFLNRLQIYIERIPVSPKMSGIVVKTMGQVLAVLALATKQISQGRLSKWPAIYNL